ncbi:DUF2510 domain-containing protein [Calidifontibacter indicus]|uniref:DUF2510 domain-containing protein n=1 Tax=Calidifontibacter indicus TaxID=419650 RepID=UPI003D72C9F6
MGFIRKSMSITSMGLVDYRSDKERAAKYAKQTRNAARANVVQNAQALEQQRRTNTALNHANAREAARPVPPPPAPVPVGPPPGWYADPDQPNAGVQRWWDGRVWTEHRQSASPPPPPA